MTINLSLCTVLLCWILLHHFSFFCFLRFTYEVAPVFTLIEEIVLQKMLGCIGWSDGEGIFAPGKQCSVHEIVYLSNSSEMTVYQIYFSHYYGVLTPLNQWWKNLSSSRGLKCLVFFPACCQIGPPKDFEIKFVLNNGRNKFSFSCPCGLGYFSTLES